jgi:hypothetical protein
VLGGIKIGSGLSIDGAGVVTAAGSTDASTLTSGTLPDARLSANVALAATVAALATGSTTAIDTIPRNVFSLGYVTTANNSTYLTFFTPQTTLTVGNITMSGGNVVATGLTTVVMALYTFDETTFTLVARTASDTSMFSVSGAMYTKPFDTATGYPASYTLQKGVRYGVALWIQGAGTFPNIAGLQAHPTIQNLAPRTCGRIAGTILQTTGTVFSTNNVTQIWSRLT